jgi:hypothetical protein
MAAPPGVTPAPTRWNHSQRQAPSRTVDALVRAVERHPDVVTAGIGHRWIARLVRRFVLQGVAEYDLVQYVVGYADPTGETAVRNVMRERGGGAR